MTSENSKRSETLMKLNSRSESHECVEADAQCPSNNQTPKRENENQPAEGSSKPHQSENVISLKAKEEELRKEICTLSSLLKKSAKSCMELKKENNNLLQVLKNKLSKDEISKLEAMNPDGNSQSLDNDDEEPCQTSSESSDESNSSSDCYSDDEEGDDSDSLKPMQIIKE
ncbi:hypothetical protein EJD97_022884 [Solanum chilense]|uniref:Uncharacterized protein n=1 Tax=Solanum chilense TaxID=4083 RepID=A0A6N2ASW8_SOLCI|nr:hypothetical protein EJD97_022884 [Solanum chilense]